jgi:nitric oxide reductase activation protein
VDVTVNQLDSKGNTTCCISLDPHADDYVSNIFGRNSHTVIDRVQRLPEKRPWLLMALTE